MYGGKNRGFIFMYSLVRFLGILQSVNKFFRSMHEKSIMFMERTVSFQ